MLQPVWAEGERSVELFRSIGSNKFTYKPFCPQRVSLSSVTDLNSSCKLTTARNSNSNSDSEVESSLDNNSADPSYSSESEAEAEVSNQCSVEKLFLYFFVSFSD